MEDLVAMVIWPDPVRDLATRRWRRWNWLLLDALQITVQARPSGCAAGPNIHRGAHCRWIVQGARTHDRELRSRGRVGKQMRATARTESAPHLVATVGSAQMLTQFAGTRERSG